MKKFISIENQPIVDLSNICAISPDDDEFIVFFDDEGATYASWKFDTTFIRDKVYVYLQRKFSIYINMHDIEGLDILNAEELFERI